MYHFNTHTRKDNSSLTLILFFSIQTMYPDNGFIAWHCTLVAQTIFAAEFFQVWPTNLTGSSSSVMVLFIPTIFYTAFTLIFKFQKIRCNTYLILKYPNDPRVPLVLFRVFQNMTFLLCLILFIAESVHFPTILLWASVFFTGVYICYLGTMTGMLMVATVKRNNHNIVQHNKYDIEKEEHQELLEGTDIDDEYALQMNQSRLHLHMTDAMRRHKLNNFTLTHLYHRVAFNLMYYSVLYPTEASTTPEHALEDVSYRCIENKSNVFPQFSLAWSLYDPHKVTPNMFWFAWFRVHFQMTTLIIQLWMLYAKFVSHVSVSYSIVLIPTIFYVMFDVVVGLIDTMKRPFASFTVQNMTYYPSTVFRKVWILQQLIVSTTLVLLSVALDKANWLSTKEENESEGGMHTSLWSIIFAFFLVAWTLPLLYACWLFWYFMRAQTKLRADIRGQ